MKPFDLLQHVRQTLLPLLPARGAILAGISGGPDSMALLHLLYMALPEARSRLRVVHVHHGLRGRDADRDEALVMAQCQKLHVPCLVFRRDVAREAAAKKISAEDAGRQARHACFLEAARRLKARAVVLAHHQDDQAETLLLRLLRGSSGQGLSAMPVSRAFPHPLAPAGLKLLRPLLSVAKADLVAWAKAKKIKSRQDRSNRDVAIARNRIRLRLLPLLARGYNPRIKQQLARTAGQSARDEAWLQAEAARRMRALAPAGQPLRLDRAGFCRLPENFQWRVLALAWEQLGIPALGYDHLERLLAAGLRPPARRSLPGGWFFEARPQALVFKPPAVNPILKPYRLEIKTGFTSNPRVPYGVKVQPCRRLTGDCRVRRGSDWTWMDGSWLDRGMQCRTLRPSDRFRPLGMGGQHKALKKVFSEMGVPVPARAGWPLIAAGSEILWVFRGPLSEPARVTPATRQIIRLQVVPSARPGSGE